MNEVTLLNTLNAIKCDCENWLNSKEKDPLLQLAKANALILAVFDAAKTATAQKATIAPKIKKKA